ncbi:LON peptidase substrate-binding domain-containing protein [Microbacterium sp. GXF7504]
MPTLPMFPLNTVLLPSMPLALRIFEERYRVMLGRVLEADDPSFGVVLIARGHEAGGDDERHDVGTLARIVQVDAGAGDIGLVAVGTDRVRVTRWLPDDPHPVAEVEPLPDLAYRDELAPLLRETTTTVRRVLARAAEYGPAGWAGELEVADDPVTAAWQLAGFAPIAQLDRYGLLQSTSLAELLRGTLDLTIAAEPALTAATPPDEFDAAIDELLRDAEDD